MICSPVSTSLVIAAMFDDVSSTMRVIEGFVSTGFLGPIPDESQRVALEAVLVDAVKRGTLSEGGAPIACMTHVDFKRRFGATKAKCLK